MSLSPNSVRPPYVRFEYRAIEDRAATIKEGRFVSRDVAFALITPPGCKDETEKIAEEWLESLRSQSGHDGREYLGEWYRGYSESYKNWKAGNEIPENGTPIRMCLMFKPSESRCILEANVRTLEDLAEASEEAIGRMGIGGRELKDRAIQWMKTNQNVSAVSEELVALKARLSALENQSKEKDATIADLTSKVINGSKRAA